RFLCREVPADRSRPHTRTPRDLVYRDGQPFGGEDLDRGLQYPTAIAPRVGAHALRGFAGVRWNGLSHGGAQPLDRTLTSGMGVPYIPGGQAGLMSRLFPRRDLCSCVTSF